ncbi:MAG: ATP-binding protein [Lachnospiraceae bacterium]|uniref:ATP-binding protein n=1 Tax=uncultured Acetatifactor sp. TaxID=1671927 RepID=UPI0026219C17|nr:ATP-binding protein [uncultured Acetatifactor sp.]MCI8790602.1 ATP-binding protein [Lachnospiraceae bacterium]
MNYISRALEDRLYKYEKTYKSILVTGARQVGKSTLLKKAFPDRRYVSLDDPFLEQQAREAGDMFLTLNAPPVTIDEVQRAKELFRYIKIKCDESEEKGLFFLSGSQPFHLMQNVSESLSGRIGIIELSGLSMRECTRDAFNSHFLPTMEYVIERKKTLKKRENIWEIIHLGGYPELQDADKEWNAFYADYVKTYMERDVRELAAVQDLTAFRQFMIAAAARTGEILNFSAIASEIGKDVKTVKNWISILEASGIVYLLEPYTSNVLKRAIKSPKLYFRDTGLVCYLTRWLTPETLAYGAMSGPVFETFAVSEILKSFSNEGLDYRHFVSYYRGRDKKKTTEDGKLQELESEIDLIIEENGVLYPIEIKKNTQAKAITTAAFDVLDQIPGKRRGMGAILCNCPQVGALRENILQIPVWYI